MTNNDSLCRPSAVVARRAFLCLVLGTGLVALSCTPGNRSAPNHQPVRFGIVTDCHYADAEAQGTRFYRESLGKLAECVDHMSAERVDFLIELGDFKDQNRPAVEEKTLAHLQTVEAVLRRFRGPRYHVLGNHDMDSISKQQYLSRVENTGIDADHSFYSFDVKGLHCLVLDANYRSDGSDYDRGNFDWTNANIPAPELDWLRRDLAEGSGATVVFTHQRLDGEGPVFVKNAAAVRQILQDSGRVLTVFQGHDHDGDYRRLDGIPYYTLKAVVEGSGAENNSYAIVELNADRSLTVTGYHRASSMSLSNAGTMSVKSSPRP
jgi:predicted phosphodiesterase